MYRLALALLLPAAAAAQTLPAPALDAARAAARQVDQATQAPRTGKESMDRVAPLLTVEPPADAAAPRNGQETGKAAPEAARPKSPRGGRGADAAP